MAYHSSYTGPQIDQAVGNALNKDTSTLSNDVNHIPASSVVKSAIDNLVTGSRIVNNTTSGATMSGSLNRTGLSHFIAVVNVGNVGRLTIAFPSEETTFYGYIYYSNTYWANVKLKINSSTYELSFDSAGTGVSAFNSVEIYGYK